MDYSICVWFCYPCVVLMNLALKHNLQLNSSLYSISIDPSTKHPRGASSCGHICICIYVNTGELHQHSTRVPLMSLSARRISAARASFYCLRKIRTQNYDGATHARAWQLAAAFCQRQELRWALKSNCCGNGVATVEGHYHHMTL